MALPGLASALPAGSSELSATQLRDRIRTSQGVGWSGYGVSRGRLVLPDVPELSDLPSLVGDTTRVRAWWRGADRWRVDALSLVGEVDTTRDPDGGWTWVSADRQALRIVGSTDVRLPQAVDLLAPSLGYRLTGTDDVTLSRLPARRVAGRSAAGLRLVPRHPQQTTVQAVDVFADPTTGLPLAVDVRAGGKVVLRSELLDLDLSAPAEARTRFTPPPSARVASGQAPDIAATVDRFAPYALPGTLAGLPRQARSPLSAGGGVGTYGVGLTALAVLPLPRDIADRVIARVDSAGAKDTGGVAELSTPLISALVATAGRHRGYLLVGTVPVARLTQALQQLRTNPPPRTER